MRDHRPVLVGVGGSSTSFHAVEWAADEARLRRCRLEIVHVLDWTDDDFLENVLRRATRVARDRHSGLSISSIEVHGSPALELIARPAQLLVVGSRPRHLRMSRLVGSTRRRVTARANCPVLAVPPSPVEPAPHPTWCAAVGVDGSAAACTAYEAALAEATKRHGFVIPIAITGLSAAEAADRLIVASRSVDLLVLACGHALSDAVVPCEPLVTSVLDRVEIPVLLIGAVSSTRATPNHAGSSSPRPLSRPRIVSTVAGSAGKVAAAPTRSAIPAWTS